MNGGPPGNFGYAGQQAEGESKLTPMGVRYYDPRTGRFLSKDPVAHSLRVQGVNRYAARNSRV